MKTQENSSNKKFSGFRKSKRFSRETKFSEIMKDEKAVEVLMNKGLHCLGCAFAQFETLEQGCRGHGIDVEQVLKELNKKRKK